MVLSIVYFQSPLSKVSNIEVTGNHNVSSDEIIKLSGLSNRTSFWKIDKEDVITTIKGHQEIHDIQLERMLPNRVLITVNEWNRIAYVVDTDNQYYPLLENGQTLPPLNNLTEQTDAPLLVGWHENGDIISMVNELTKLPEGITNAISEIHYEPTNSDPHHLKLYMNNGYEVSVTIRGFAKKMEAYPSVIGELDPSMKGIIHLDVVPFFEQYKDNDVENEEGDEMIESEG